MLRITPSIRMERNQLVVLDGYGNALLYSAKILLDVKEHDYFMLSY